jgi:RING finger protein 113A
VEAPGWDTKPDGRYKGVTNYLSFRRRIQIERRSKSGQSNLPRTFTITVTDFAPNVCKDYKQTGFSAVFWGDIGVNFYMHVRTTSKEAGN